MPQSRLHIPHTLLYDAVSYIPIRSLLSLGVCQRGFSGLQHDLLRGRKLGKRLKVLLAGFDQKIF